MGLFFNLPAIDSGSVATYGRMGKNLCQKNGLYYAVYALILPDFA